DEVLVILAEQLREELRLVEQQLDAAAITDLGGDGFAAHAAPSRAGGGCSGLDVCLPIEANDSGCGRFRGGVSAGRAQCIRHRLWQSGATVNSAKLLRASASRRLCARSHSAAHLPPRDIGDR